MEVLMSNTKRALKDYSGNDGNGFNFMEREKADRFRKMARDKREKIWKRARAPKFSHKDEYLLKQEINKMVASDDPQIKTLFNLLQRAKAAEKDNPNDKGVSALRILLERKWSKNRTAELEGKELSDVRNYFSRMYPGSYVNELLTIDPMHKTPKDDYGQVDSVPDPMHKRIYIKIAAYPDGEREAVEIPEGSLIKICDDLELQKGDFENPVVIETDTIPGIFVTEKTVLDRASVKVLEPAEVAKKIAELLVKYPRAKHQIDVVASEESGFSVELVRRAQKFGLNNDTKLFLVEWDAFKKVEKEASEYTDFVSKHMKENPGSSMSDAGAAWKSQKGKDDEVDEKEEKEEVEEKDAQKEEEKKEDKEEEKKEDDEEKEA
jgi:hypothetical protein